MVRNHPHAIPMKFMLSNVSYGVVYPRELHPVQRRQWGWMEKHMTPWTRNRKQKTLLRLPYGTKLHIDLGVMLPQGWEFTLTDAPSANFYKVQNLNPDYLNNGYSMVRK